MPRIAHVLSTPSGLGGAEHLVASLARHSAELADSAAEVLVLNAGQDPDMGEALSQACAPVEVRAGGSDLGPRALRSWLGRELAAFRPDIVHVHLARAAVLVASLPRQRGRRLVLTHHHGQQFAAQGRRAAALVDSLSGRRYDAVVAVSSAVREALVGELRYPPGRVTTIVNGWAGTPLPRQPSDRPTIVCVGRLRAEKGHAVLLEAFRLVLEQVPRAQLELLGDGPEGPSLRAQAQALGVADRTAFRGDVDSVWPRLARADVVAQPSRTETFGIAALEALAAGAPVVASRVGGLPELLEDGRAGLLVPAGAPAPLADALVQVLTRPDLAAELARAGLERADGLRLEQTLDRYAVLYAGLVAAAST